MIKLDRINKYQHRARYAVPPNVGKRVRIDVNIYELITNMWKLGIMTASCCGGSCSGRCGHKQPPQPPPQRKWTMVKGKRKYYWYHDTKLAKKCQESVYIHFPSVRDYEKFADAVVLDTYDDWQVGAKQDFISEQIRHWRRRPANGPDNWSITMEIDDMNDSRYLRGLGDTRGKKGPQHRHGAYVIISFPWAHIDELTKRIQKKVK